MRESGFSLNYKFVLVAEVKAKTVTNNLPLLSVLCGVLYFSSLDCFAGLGLVSSIMNTVIPLNLDFKKKVRV